MKRHLPWIATALPLFLVGAYMLLTLPFSYPEEWDRIEKGMTRLEVCQAVDFPLELFRDSGIDPALYFKDTRIAKRGLRKWILHLEYTGDKVSKIIIFKRDFHEDFGPEGTLLI